MDTMQNDELEQFGQHLRILKGRASSSIGRYRAHVAEFRAWRAGNALTTPIVSVEPLKLRQEVEEYLDVLP
jgi:hypothetical protein